MLPQQQQVKTQVETEKMRVLKDVIASALRMRFATIILRVEHGELRRIEGPAPIIKLK